MATVHLVFPLQPYLSDFNPKILLFLLAKLRQPGGVSIGLCFPWIGKPIRLSVWMRWQEVRGNKQTAPCCCERPRQKLRQVENTGWGRRSGWMMRQSWRWLSYWHRASLCEEHVFTSLLAGFGQSAMSVCGTQINWTSCNYSCRSASIGNQECC